MWTFLRCILLLNIKGLPECFINQTVQIKANLLLCKEDMEYYKIYIKWNIFIINYINYCIILISHLLIWFNKINVHK